MHNICAYWKKKKNLTETSRNNDDLEKKKVSFLNTWFREYIATKLNTVTTKQRKESWESLLSQQASVESSSLGIFPLI